MNPYSNLEIPPSALASASASASRPKCQSCEARCKWMWREDIHWSLHLLKMFILFGTAFGVCYLLGYWWPIIPASYFKHDYENMEQYTVSGIVFVFALVFLYWVLDAIYRCCKNLCCRNGVTNFANVNNHHPPHPHPRVAKVLSGTSIAPFDIQDAV